MHGLANTTRAAAPRFNAGKTGGRRAARLPALAILALALMLALACSGRQEVAGRSGTTGSAPAGAESQAVPAATRYYAAPVLDACALIGQANADAVLGTPARIAAHEKDDRHASHCNYESVDLSHGMNGFGVSIHNDESAFEAKTGQTMKQGLYSNFQVYDSQLLQGIGDGAFLALNKPPPGAAFTSGPLADLVARQQILMLIKGARDIEIVVSYFGKARSTDAVKAMARDLAAKV